MKTFAESSHIGDIDKLILLDSLHDFNAQVGSDYALGQKVLGMIGL